MPMRTFAISVVCIAMMLSAGAAKLRAEPGNGDSKKLRVKWQKDEAAERYRVQIRDTLDKLVLEKEVDSNYVDFILPPGKYRMRIGAITKFGKIGGWSDWRYFEITRRVVPEYAEGVKNIGLKIGVGICYFQMLPEFDAAYDNSFESATVTIAYSFGKMAVFTDMRFLRFIGLELESGYVKFSGKSDPDRITIDNTDILIGGNLYATTMFRFPVNIILRAGGGLAFTQFDYYDIDGQGTNESLDSQDPFYKIGCSLEYSITRSFYFEAGVDYYVITYIGNEFRTLRYFGLVGMRL